MSKHLNNVQKLEICDWIKSRKTKPSWQQVADEIKRKFGIEQKANTIVRNPDFNAAMEARKATPTERDKIGAATPKKLERLIEENDRLKVEVADLQATNAALIEERIEMLNYASAHRISEKELRRPLVAIDRHSTEDK